MDANVSEIARLRDQVWARDERIRQLEQEITGSNDLNIKGEALRLGLSPVETKVWGVLRSREIASQKTIYTVLYGARLYDPPEESIVRAHIFNMRRKIGPHGYHITNYHGHGWKLERGEYVPEVAG